MVQHIKIIGTGKALPERVVSSSSLEKKLGLKAGRLKQLTGLDTRFFVDKETASELAVTAINGALEQAKLGLDDIDCIVSGSGTMEQAIPYNAAAVHKALNPVRPIQAFDVNMTCLSALMALDVASRLLLSSDYQNIVIVSSDIASVGLNWDKLESAAIFGDGAAAMIISRSNTGGILASRFETHSVGYDHCVIPGGGSRRHPSNTPGNYLPHAQFQMQGKEVYRLAAKILPKFVDQLLKSARLTMEDIDWVVPHQASQLALDHIKKRLTVSNDQLIDIFSSHGNQIAASIPTALHELFVNRPLSPGDKILMVGTSAGMSLGGVVLEHAI